jgi:ATP-dependent DNA ligase
VQLYAFDILALDGDDLRKLPLSLRKTNLAQLLRGRPDGIFVAPFEQGEIGLDLFRVAPARVFAVAHMAFGAETRMRSDARGYP